MTPAARFQAAIEILDQVVAAARDNGPAADTLIARYFRDRRYAGSKDRRAVRDLAYAAIRRAGERPESGRAAMLGVVADQPELAALFDGSPHGPMPIAEEPVAGAGLAPAWLMERLAHLDGAEQAALLDRAPLDLRVNRLKAGRDGVIGELPGAVALGRVPDGVRLADGLAIDKHPLFLSGMVEVQDEASQLVVAACAAAPGMTVVDLCAGAGGKALALAAAMANDGRLIACDTDRTRLSRLTPRAERAGAAVETRLLNPGREMEVLHNLAGAADLVLVDAPCSGSGTWRRNPEARWRLTGVRLERLNALQDHVLGLGAQLVRPGGQLVYAVCSVLHDEGARRVDGLLAAAPDRWQPQPLPFDAGVEAGAGRMLTPGHDGTDGFFVARLARTC